MRHLNRGVESFVPQPRDLDLLRSLFESRVMTLNHLAALHFDRRVEAAKKRLQKLKAAGFVAERHRRPYEPAVLFLARTGIELLRDEGILAEYPPLVLPVLERRARVSDLTVRHELEVMDVRGLPLGFGWNFTPSVSVKDNITNAIVFYGDGHSEVHASTPDGYIGDPGVFDHLQKTGEEWLIVTKNQTTNRVNAFGRLVAIQDRNGNQISLEYEAEDSEAKGRLKQIVDTANRVTFFHGYPGTLSLIGSIEDVYDSQGNPVSTTNALEFATSVTFFPNGLPNVATDARGFCFTNLWENGNLVETVDALGHRTQMLYDAVRYPGGNEVHYGYDSLNRMESFTNWLGGEVHYQRDVRGLVTHSSNANGTSVDMAFDATGRSIAITNWSPASVIIASEIALFDALRNQTNQSGIKTLVPILQTANVNYSYDDNNRLGSVGGKVVTHDNNGNLIGLGSDSYRFDFDNRLLSYAVGGALGGQYRYDGLGNRIEHSPNGIPRRFVLDRLGSLTQVLAETDDAGTIVAYYVYGLGLAQRITPDGQTDTYQFDLRGSTIATTSDAAQLVSAYAYDTFGTLADSEEERAQPFRYLGQYGIMDDGNGLYHARARYFSPSLGRFISQDPLLGNASSSQSLNRYVYAFNNPLRYSDASGLSATDALKAQWRNETAALNADEAYWKAYYKSASWMIPYLRTLEVAGQIAGFAADVLSVGELTVFRGALKQAVKRIFVSEVTTVTETGASSAVQGAKLSEHLGQLEKYGSNGFKQLENGVNRYYGELVTATKQGEMAGTRVVREWNPFDGVKRTWLETLDHNGTVRSVRPQTEDGTKIHYVFDAVGKYIGTR